MSRFAGLAVAVAMLTGCAWAAPTVEITAPLRAQDLVPDTIYKAMVPMPYMVKDAASMMSHSVIRDVYLECNGLAAIGLRMDVVAHRDVRNVYIEGCTDTGLLVNGTQNSSFSAIHLLDNGWGMRVTHRAHNNLFTRVSASDNKMGGLIVAENTSDPVPAYYDQVSSGNGPSHNVWDSCIFERGLGHDAQVVLAAGFNNTIRSSVIEATVPTTVFCGPNPGDACDGASVTPQYPLWSGPRNGWDGSHVFTLEDVHIDAVRPIRITRAWNVRINGLSFNRLADPGVPAHLPRYCVVLREARGWTDGQHHTTGCATVVKNESATTSPDGQTIPVAPWTFTAPVTQTVW